MSIYTSGTTSKDQSTHCSRCPSPGLPSSLLPPY